MEALCEHQVVYLVLRKQEAFDICLVFVRSEGGRDPVIGAQYWPRCYRFSTAALNFIHWYFLAGDRLFPSVQQLILDLIPLVSTLLPGKIGNMHKIQRICIKSIMQGLGIPLSLSAVMDKLLERGQYSPRALLLVSGACLGRWRELLQLFLPLKQCPDPVCAW